MIRQATQFLWIAVVYCLSILLMMDSQTLADSRTRANDALTSLLQSEADGGITDRGPTLEAIMKSAPAHAPSRWQAGFVQSGRRWFQFDQLPVTDSHRSTLESYRNLREELSESFPERMKLANWCRKHKLNDRERVHLTEALRLQPQSVDVMQRLGFRRVGSSWLSPRQLQILEDKQKLQETALKTWHPRLEKVREDLLSGSKRRKRNAQKRLSMIDDPAAVVAIESVLFDQGETCELAAVESLRYSSSYQAAHALVRLVLRSENFWVRKAVIAALKSKPESDYVPPLLLKLKLPVNSQVTVPYVDNWNMHVQWVTQREGQYRQQVKVVNTNIRIHRNAARERGLAFAVFERNLEDFSREQRDETHRGNRQIEDANERVFAVLRATTQQDLADDPSAWWGWWNVQQDWTTTSKPVDYQQIENRLVLGAHSCLRAGTPVWTEDGLVAIEKIQAGDRVLSKNVETGELAYKPVLRPTVGPELELKQFELDDETIICTEGHPFWISGRGWTMVKDFQPGAQLHTVTGTASIRAVSAGPSEKVYNLIVADFHTYFVGRTKILSHDNTLREPTNVVVPGLVAK